MLPVLTASGPATIICPGPSIERFDPAKDAEGPICGVNRAVRYARCDYWCALDKRTFSLATPLGKPVAVTRAVHWPAKGFDREAPMWDVNLFRWYRTAPEHWKYSSLTALVFFAWRGFDTVHVWGRDLSGVADWDGDDAVAYSRTEARWGREGRLWTVVTEKAGIEVVLH